MSPSRSWIVAVAVVMGTGAAHAGINEVKTVSFDADAATTHVVVRGTQTPTFSVYKLEKPTRVVVDVPNARLSSSLAGHDNVAALSANTWAVSAINAQQLDDDGPQVRIVITLARPGRYDV